ncbi:MAG: hypothetical protein RLY16_1807 [Bacteroidota bacterium]|jgi:ABC-type Fe3+-hydroxamate transport system substrate-binding protein
MMLLDATALLYKPTRIVSLVPSQTELLFDLQLNEEVLGITKFCIHPGHWKKEKQIIGGTKQIHLDRIRALQPDLIIANKEENIKEEVLALAEEFPVWVTDVNDLSDAIQMIRDIGRLTQTLPKANEIVNQIENNFQQISTPTTLISTCYLIWQSPYMSVGKDTFIHDIISRAGFKNVCATFNRYPTISEEWLKEVKPELLFLSSEPYPFKEKHIAALQAILPTSKVILVDGEMFSWYGSRLIKTANYLKILQKTI